MSLLHQPRRRIGWTPCYLVLHEQIRGVLRQDRVEAVMTRRGSSVRAYESRIMRSFTVESCMLLFDSRVRLHW